MSAAPKIDLLMNELGPVLDPLAIRSHPDHQGWSLLLDEETLLLVDLDDEARKLVLSHDVGEPPDGDRFALYELMLVHNHQWDRTGGRRMAVDLPGGSVVMLQDIAIQDLDVPTLCGLITSFAEAARVWRRVVAKPGADPAAPKEPLDGPGPHQAMQV